MNIKILLIIIIFPPLVWLVGKFIKYLLYQKVKRESVVYSQYDPPFNLSPAECGYLFEGTIGMPEFLGTLFHMTQRGLLRFYTSSSSFELVDKINNSPEIRDYEYGIISYLRKNEFVPVAELINSAEGLELCEQLSVQIRQELIKKGYLQRSKLARIFWQIHNGGWIFGITYILLLASSFFYVHQTLIISNEFESLTNFLLQGLAVILAVIPASLAVLYINLILYLYFSSIGIPWAATKSTVASWDDIAGYRAYLEVVEAPRLNQQADASNIHHAYCIAFGFAKV